MPEIFETDVRASQVRKGDLIDGQQVQQSSSKVKWTFITVSNDLPVIKLENDAFVRVQRSRPTAEEAAQAELEGKLYFLDLAEQRAVKDYADAQRRVLEAVNANDWNVASRMQDLLQAKAVANIWLRVQQVHLNCATSEKLEPITRLEAHAKVLEKVREEVLEFSRWSSRSTSTWSNAVEDLELDAKSRFLRDAKWNLSV